MMKSPLQPRSTRRRAVALAISVAGMALWIGAVAGVVSAQTPGLVQLPVLAPPAVKEKVRSLQEWRDDVQQRLTELAASANQETEAIEDQPAPPSWLADLLPRLDLTLAQLVSANEEAAKADVDHKKQQKELDDFRRNGPPTDDATSFAALDRARDELATEQQQLARRREKEKTASSALKSAEADLSKQRSERRRIQEALATNADDQPHDQIVEARLVEELADAIAQLRKQELLNAKQAVATQQLRNELSETKVSRLLLTARFDASELAQLIVQIRREEDRLKSSIALSQRAKAEQQMRTDGLMKLLVAQLPSAGDGNALREQVDASRLRLRVHEENLPLLQKQLDRLAAQRATWQRRQTLFIGRPERRLVREWTNETDQALERLASDRRVAEYGLEDLRKEIRQRDERLAPLDAKSSEARSITSQIKSLRRLVQAHEKNLANVEVTQRLYAKLRDELKSDSLTATAKDRLLDLWYGVAWLWNYPLTEVGDSDVTVKKVVSALLLLAAGFICSRALSRSLGRQVLRRLDIDASASATIQSLFYYLLILLFSLVALKVVKVPLTAFTVLGGAVALGVGFGSQNIINNFISGLILLAERPVKVGDLIKIGDLYGNIEHIGPRSTRIRTGANLEIIVPNSSFLQNNVINFTLSNDRVRTMVEVGVIYGSPTVTVTQLLRRAVVETGRVAKDPPPIILFKNFGDSSLVFEIHFWIRMRRMMDQLQIESAVRYRIDQLFREEGIVIAFPQHDVHLDTSTPLAIQMVDGNTKES